MLALLALAACSDSMGPKTGPPARLDVVSGDLQTGAAGDELSQPLVVRVVDAKNKPVKGQVVNFLVTAGNGAVFAGTALTNDNGEARERWRLDTTVGDTQRVEARAVDATTGQAQLFAVFRAVGRPGAPATLTTMRAAAATAVAESPFADSLSVLARDQFGHPVPGAVITWDALAGGGAFAPAQSTTGTDGIAATVWTVTPRVDSTKTARASVGTLTATFTLAGTPPRVAQALDLFWQGVPETRRSAQAGSGTEFVVVGSPVQLIATVRDQNGAVLPGVPVTFAPRAGSGSVNPVTVVSDATGRATATWTLGTQIDATARMRVVATAGALADTTDAPVAPDSAVAVRATPDSVIALAVGDSVTVSALVLDRYGNNAIQWYNRDNRDHLYVTTPDTGVVDIHIITRGTLGPWSAWVVAKAPGDAALTVEATTTTWATQTTLVTLTGTARVHVTPAPSAVRARARERTR